MSHQRCHRLTMVIRLAVSESSYRVISLSAQAVESEGKNRMDIMLPGMQPDLIAAVVSAAGARGVPIIMLVLSGGCLDLSEYESDPRVGAILWAGYPGQVRNRERKRRTHASIYLLSVRRCPFLSTHGFALFGRRTQVTAMTRLLSQAGGQAIAEALFGAFSPTGRTTQTWYKSDFLSQARGSASVHSFELWASLCVTICDLAGWSISPACARCNPPHLGAGLPCVGGGD